MRITRRSLNHCVLKMGGILMLKQFVEAIYTVTYVYIL